MFAAMTDALDGTSGVSFPSCLNMKLTSTQTRYLLTIYKLCENDTGVRSNEIAESLGVSRPSVSRMLGNLADIGLLYKKRYGIIYLTESGKTLAARCDQELRKLGTQLETILSVPSKTARECALLLISELMKIV